MLTYEPRAGDSLNHAVATIIEMSQTAKKLDDEARNLAVATGVKPEELPTPAEDAYVTAASFNGIEIRATPDADPKALIDAYCAESAHQAAVAEERRKAYEASPEYAEECRKRQEAHEQEIVAGIELASHGEELVQREADVPRIYTIDELVRYVEAHARRTSHDYGTCVNAMAMSALAALEYVSHVIGVTGLQHSCADIDFVRRTDGRFEFQEACMDTMRRSRRIEGPFMLVRASDALYPQCDPSTKLADALKEWRPWLAKKALEMLLERVGEDGTPSMVHPNVEQHWRQLVQRDAAPYQPAAFESVAETFVRAKHLANARQGVVEVAPAGFKMVVWPGALGPDPEALLARWKDRSGIPDGSWFSCDAEIPEREGGTDEEWQAAVAACRKHHLDTRTGDVWPASLGEEPVFVEEPTAHEEFVGRQPPAEPPAEPTAETPMPDVPVEHTMTEVDRPAETVAETETDGAAEITDGTTTE